MAENIYQIFQENPITTNSNTDLMYFGQSPYGIGNDAAMTYQNFAAQFGVADLNSFTLHFTFATPGDLAVVYTSQTGFYVAFGHVVFVVFNVTCTPTFSTSSGVMELTGLPFTSGTLTSAMNVAGSININNVSYGAGASPYCYILPNTNFILVAANSNNATATTLSTSNFASGTAINLVGSIFYFK